MTNAKFYWVKIDEEWEPAAKLMDGVTIDSPGKRQWFIFDLKQAKASTFFDAIGSEILLPGREPVKE